MNIYLPPSKTVPSEAQITRFNTLYRKVHARLAPGTPEEHSLCNEIVVGLWHYRRFRSTAEWIERQLKQLADPAAATGELQKQMLAAFRQSKLQKNFAWRRRNQFFTLKTARENLVRRPKAA
ncbi:MAG: hypothetical protein ABIQ44_04755 [Chloroflexia bacterium]